MPVASLLPPPPPPHPASARASNNKAASGRIADHHRPAPVGLRRLTAQSIVARIKANNIRPRNPGDRGGTGERAENVAR